MAGSKEVYFETLRPGDIIFAEIVIDPRDTADPGSTTARTIAEGEPIRHPCVVLSTGTDGVEVTYMATFKERSSLPRALDKSMWYPISPAPYEGFFYPPLPPRWNGKAQWVSLRARHPITKRRVRKFDETFPVASLNVITLHMRA
ncbi:hypothetical protein EDD16DRAFT_1099725 [Pisolithus croceorrhizus]|nr:hypothetical protein EV401DRAFT_287870 [Pisolithus croceorrhizus]KAI6114988.1 hypothetical protein EDD16DRAFT_1099725 [Pisolithus croceorrhizus]